MLIAVKKAFENAIYPDKCMACGLFFHAVEQQAPHPTEKEYFQKTSLAMIFKHEMSKFLCPSCIKEFSPMTAPFCSQCGKAFDSPTSDNHLCGDCIQNNKPFQRVRSAGLFAGSLMNMIHKLKYAGKVQLALPLGRLLFGAYMRYFDDIEVDVIIPVPLHTSKLRARGFNQTLLMLAQWPDLAAGIKSNDFQIDFHNGFMDRKKKTESQTGLDRKKRKLNVKGAFSVLRPDVIKGKKILLVDDVYTTGATTEECAKMLVNNGARDVHILTLARAG
jgi:ComF family protein